ncbi:M23/M37 peptidase domain protein [Pseudomonas sp. Os17]|nr:M23/M37 peptidase domain protein [Pseudomonas sp. Os17]BAQ78789.1 M23/M37 peptidase domain protein [Pseudomonas sp. St29]
MQFIGGQGGQAGERAGAEGQKGEAATEMLHGNSLSAVRRVDPDLRETFRQVRQWQVSSRKRQATTLVAESLRLATVFL